MKTEVAGDSVLLRPYTLNDVDALYQAVRESIAEMSPWLPWCHANYSIAESRDFISSRLQAANNGEWYSFGVFEKEDGKLLGGVGLNFINQVHRLANLGYWVRTSATGRGVASTATRLAARFAFAELGLERVEILAAVDNLASQRVAEKAGALREATLRNRLYINGHAHDAVLFSLIPADLA